MQWMLTLRLNTFLVSLSLTITHTGVLDQRLTFTHSHKFSQLNVLGPSTSTFFNLAISNINPASYRELYPVAVLVELAHVKEREHEKRVDKPPKSAKYLRFGTCVQQHGWCSTHVLEYCTVLVLAPCAGVH